MRTVHGQSAVAYHYLEAVVIGIVVGDVEIIREYNCQHAHRLEVNRNQKYCGLTEWEFGFHSLVILAG